MGRTLIKAPKLYFLDTGLLCHLLGISNESELLLSDYKGRIVETFAISEVLKIRYNCGKKEGVFFYRDKDKLEVDLVIEEKKKNYAIEIKSDSTPSEKHARELKRFLRARKGEEYIEKVFYLGNMDINLNDVQYVPWERWDETIREMD